MADGEYYPEGYRPSYEPLSSKDPEFMKWFLDLEKQVEEQRYIWLGYRKDETGQWKKTTDSVKHRLMNEQGAEFCVQFLKSFLGRSVQSSSYDDNYVRFVMREYVSTPVFMSLEAHYYDFEFKRGSDLEMVALEICNLCLGILNGARGEGYRRFLTQTHQVQEIKTTPLEGDKKGFFSNTFSRFSRQTPQEQYYRQGGN
jgi:hypothetical protein